MAAFRFQKGNKLAKGGYRENAGRKRDEVKALLIDGSPKATKRILELVDSDNEKVALAAATVVIEHSIGKPTQPLEHSGADGEPLGITVQFVKAKV